MRDGKLRTRRRIRELRVLFVGVIGSICDICGQIAFLYSQPRLGRAWTVSLRMIDTLSTRNAVSCDDEGLLRKEVRSHAQAYTCGTAYCVAIERAIKRPTCIIVRLLSR
jgi:hypothetical protein